MPHEGDTEDVINTRVIVHSTRQRARIPNTGSAKKPPKTQLWIEPLSQDYRADVVSRVLAQIDAPLASAAAGARTAEARAAGPLPE